MIKKDNLINLLNSYEKTKEILSYTDEELKNNFGELFSEQKNYSQSNPHHCYDLLGHTVYTVLAVQDMPIDKKYKDILLTAALFHDVGKPRCRLKKGNRYVFYNHESISADISDNLLKEIGYNEEERALICFLIKQHGVFIPFKFESEIYASSYFKIINKENILKLYADLSDSYNGAFNTTIFNLLCDLSIADCKAQSEKVIINNRIVDTKEDKINRVNKIREIITENRTGL